MALNFRQQQLFRSLLSIYRADARTENPTSGEVSDDHYSLVVANVPCFYDYTQNDDDAVPGLGRVKRRSALTEDAIHMEVTADIRSQDYVRDVTPGSPNFGTVHRIEGEPRKIPDQGGRHFNGLIVQAMDEPHVPAQLAGLF